MKRGHRYRYSVLKPENSKDSRLSVGLAAVSGAAFLFCVFASAFSGGSGGTYIGAVGLAATLLSLFGCLLGLGTLKKKENRSVLAFVGAICCGVLFILWLMIFLVGWKS